MRAGARLSRNVWVSFGPVGWLIFLPFLLAVYAVWLIVALVMGIIQLTITLCQRAKRS